MIRTLCSVLLVLVAAGVVAGEELPRLLAPDGEVVELGAWLSQKGPAAVVVWASWSPRADEVLLELEAMAAACRERGLELLLVDVQEPIEGAAEALDGHRVTWLHDRHGAVLKHFRVITVPALIIVSGEGRVAARPQAVSAHAIASWRPQASP
jgi:hypothetical protein